MTLLCPNDDDMASRGGNPGMVGANIISRIQKNGPRLPPTSYQRGKMVKEYRCQNQYILFS